MVGTHTCLLSILPNMDMPKPFSTTAYCLAYFTHVDGYGDNLNILNVPKDSQNICNELKSTVVCHALT